VTSSRAGVKFPIQPQDIKSSSVALEGVCSSLKVTLHEVVS
jgi:hypothetical protein